MTWRFKEFVTTQVKGVDEASFLTGHPYALLLSEGQGASGASGKIVAGDVPTRKIGTVEELAAYTNESSDEAWVVPVRRKADSQLSIITVGRGEECDIRLAHPLISKKHAYFQQDGQGWLLADAESTNCTFVDGDKLEAHKPRRLNDSVVLRFGPAVKYRFFGPQSFYAYCAMRSRMKDPGAPETRRVGRPS